MSEHITTQLDDQRLEAQLRFTPMGQLVEASGPLHLILGWPGVELYGHRLLELVHRGDQAQLENFLRHPNAGTHSEALRLMHQSKAWQWCQLTWLSRQDEIEITLAEEIPERPSKRNRRQGDQVRKTSGPIPLASLLNALGSITDQSKFILLLGEHNQVRYISPNFLTASGQRHDDVIDLTLEQLWPTLGVEFSSTEAAKRFLSGIEQRKQASLEKATVTPLKGESFAFSLEAHSLRWDETDLTLIAGTPASDRRERLAARAMSNLQREALGALVHEFRNVLNIVTGHTELLNGTELTAEQASSVKQLAKYASHSVALNESLSLVPHFYGETFDTLDLGSALKQGEPLLRLLWRNADNLTLETDQSDLQVNVNRGQLLAELLEMTRALRRQTSSDAQLLITLSRRNAAQSGDLLDVSSHRYQAVISLKIVSDPQTLNSPELALGPVAELQTSAASQLEATTAHLRDFLVSCGGELLISISDEAMQFDLMLPDLSQEDASDPTQSNTKTILLIEDDTGVRDLVVIFLESIGMEVVAIQSEDELKALPARNYALIVSDVMLPGARSGPELVAMVRRHQTNLPCLFISGYKQGVLTDEDLEAELTDFLPKPFSKSAFLQKVRAFIPE